MGYAFTYPFVRFITGGEINIGAYTHYPTVSADMVKRVRERAVGVESGLARTSWLKTKIKLVWVQRLEMVIFAYRQILPSLHLVLRRLPLV